MTQERELMLGLKQGDQQAFNSIYHSYSERLSHFVRSLVKLESETEDIVQQVFVNLWLKREQVDPDKNLSSFLYTIARNTTLNMLREANTHKNYLREQVWRSIELSRCFTDESIAYDELLKQIQEALQKLSPHKKQIFEMSRKDGMTHEEIGKKLGLSKNTVKNHITESIKLIRREIESSTDTHSALSILLLWIFS